MSEVGKAEQSKIQIYKPICTYRNELSTDTELKIFDFFTQHHAYFQVKKIKTSDILNDLFGLNADNSKDYIISDEDIENFLAKCKQGNYEVNGVKVKTKKLKDVSVDDMKKFLVKLLELNPTEKEIKYKNFHKNNYTNENGENILNKKLFDLSEEGYISPYNVPSDYKNEDLKLLDLNEDGKIDSLEYNFWSQEYKDLILKGLSKIDAESNDKKITKEEKNKIYEKLVETDNEKNYNTLTNLSLKDEHGNEVITDEVKSLFNLQKTEISIDDLTDENGNIKAGLELFDLNGDKKLDDKEKAYFGSQGKIVGAKDKITLGDFITILKKLQLFDLSKEGITDSELKILHNYIDSTFLMLKGLEGMPNGIKELYEKALGSISTIGTKQRHSAGEYNTREKSIKLKFKENKHFLASTLLHELTHHLCYNFSGKQINSMAQEVQCFYMECKLEEQFAKLPGSKYQLSDEANEAKILKDNNPELNELDIAKFLFMKNHYDCYSKRYNMHGTNYIFNVDYMDINGYFKEDKNKKAIYEAGIQKAFNGLELYDENGNNLITDELKNLFTPERPIIGYKDLLDENGNIKEGLELFKTLIDDPKGNNTKNYFSMITYNDIPRIVDRFKKINTEAVSSKDLFFDKDYNETLTKKKKEFFINNVVGNTILSKTFDYHKR